MEKTRALQRAIDGYAPGPKALAAALGMNYFTMLHKANPRQPAQGFNPEEGIALQRETGDHGGVMVEAEQLGYLLLRRPDAVPDERAMALATQALREFSEYMQVWTEALADNDVTANEMQRIDDELAQAMGRMQAMRAHVAALHARRVPVAAAAAAATKRGGR